MTTRSGLHHSLRLGVGALVLGLMLIDLASAQGRPMPAKAGVKADPKAAGPTVVMDTSLGRVTCVLFSQQAPVTVANFVGLADGSKDWTDGGSGGVVHGKPFYDGIAFNGVTDGVTAGDRMGGGKGLAGAAFAEEKSGLGFDRAGRLVMGRVPPAKPGDKAAAEMTSSSIFYILAHADAEFARKGGTVFGQCDAASVAVVTAISHALLSSDNHPAEALGIYRMTVVRAGDALPAVAAVLPATVLTPQPVPLPVAEVPSPEPTGPTAVMDIAMGGVAGAGVAKGKMTCRLFEKEAPVGVANFIGLVNGTKDFKSSATHAMVHGKRFYDGLSFKRIIPDFMIQNADRAGDVPKFENEIVPGLTYDRPGRLAYANSGPGTNTSEFFITEHTNHRLDGNYTIFGQCDAASVKLVETIARVPRDEHNKPLTPVVIRRITIVPVGR
jgi:cyclophilin family peptidyl-prolyl cis-trans isomerase